MSLLSCSFSGATGGMTAVYVFVNKKHKQHHLDLCQFLGHPLSTASNGHEVILSSEIQFLSHNLLYGLVGVYH